LDSTKQEAIDVLLFGSSFNSDLADRARMLLPPNYINGNHFDDFDDFDDFDEIDDFDDFDNFVDFEDFEDFLEF